MIDITYIEYFDIKMSKLTIYRNTYKYDIIQYI